MFNQLMAGIDFAQQPTLHYRYAIDLAVSLGSSLDLLHVFHPDRIKGRLRSTKNSQDLLAHFQQRMRTLRPAPPLSPLPPEILDRIVRQKSVRQGLPEEEFRHYAQQAEIDLLLLHVNGFSYPFREELGQVIVQMILEAPCPVLLLPEDIYFRGFKKILFLGEEAPTSPPLQQEITGSAFLFGADIHYLQINYHHQNTNVLPGTSFHQAIQNILPGMKAQYAVSSYEQLIPQLNQYLTHHDIDLLYFIGSNRYFWPNWLQQQLKNHYPLRKSVPIMIKHLD